LILSTLHNAYNSETWNMTVASRRITDVLEMPVVRRIEGLTRDKTEYETLTHGEGQDGSMM